MSTPDSPYKTLSNIRLAIIRDIKETTASNFVTQVDRWINEGHELVTLGKKRDWLDEQFTVQVSSAVQAVCHVTNGSTTVTFVNGTTFPSGVELQFWSNGFQEVYNVASATLNVVTLDKPFLGDSNTATTGIVAQSSIILDASIRHIYQAYHQFDNAPMTDIGPQQMRLLQEGQGYQLGYGRFFTIFGQSEGARRFVPYPYPEKAYTLYLDCNTFVPVLSADSDEPVIPIQYRQILYWYGMYKAYMYHRNDGQAASAYTNYIQILNRINAEMRPELDFPQIQVYYPRGRSLKTFSPRFDPRIRDS